MSILLDGSKIAESIRQTIKSRVEKLDHKPGLAVILVGADPASHTYVNIKRKACEEVSIRFESFLYFATEPEEHLIEKIHELNQREDIHGILVQLPLPAQNADRVIAAIDPKKDVDGFHPENLRRLESETPQFIPPVALGILKLIESTQQDFRKKNATIVSSEFFARPLVVLLQNLGVDSAIVSPSDPNLAQKTAADILIVAAGIPGLITGSMIKPGAIVIDVGTTRVEEKLCGDVDRESVETIAGYLTPVPGGVGPMTVAMLLENVMKGYVKI